MKFLCGNCKAKYQIADEKVTGRTLRMKCRRCGHDILIDGHTMPQSTPPSSAPASRRGNTVSVVPGPRAGSGANPPPTRSNTLPRPAASRSKPPLGGLSAEFRRHVAAPPEVPQRNAPYDLWHVAIQDVPVGPMTRDELARKIDAGAVTPDSLCWREGMDDWRPVGELAELAALLRRNRDAPRPMRGRSPPNVPGPGASGSRAAPLPAPAPATAPVSDDYDEDNAEPTRISEFTPELALATSAAGSAQPFTPSPAAQSHAQPQVGGGTSPRVVVPQVASPLSDVATQLVQQPQQGLAQRMGTWGMLAIGLLVGILLIAGPKLVRDFWGSPEEKPTASVAPTPEPKQAPKPSAPVLELPEPEDEPEPSAEDNGRSVARSTSRGQKQPAAAPKPDPAPAGKALTEQQRKLLERMGGGGDDSIAKIGTRGVDEPAGGSANGPALTPQQLTKVVQDNKNQLQRCYETALRAAGGKQDGAIKISVNVLVGGSGTTKSVSTQGDGLGNMTDCIRSAVKRWRFPQAGSESEFAFPLVFQPGA